MLIIAIAGGTASGKSTVAEKVADLINSSNGTSPIVSIMSADWYYKCLRRLTHQQRATWNFDEPNAIDWELMQVHMEELRQGKSIMTPRYDFNTHTRCDRGVVLAPTPIVILDGIMIFHDPDFREIFDYRVFVDVDERSRFLRRLKRDTADRGRTPRSVKEQWDATVQPGHDLYVEPVKGCAHTTIKDGGFNDAAIRALTAQIVAMHES
ncbi:uridine kinase [Candidatus Parcubacteria bacterium]|nr:uridine kinase [Candidatus Parcubacteria bacterium]MBT3948549.1 uridine kinase [Candidatus Parcubacteria bacterium]